MFYSHLLQTAFMLCLTHVHTGPTPDPGTLDPSSSTPDPGDPDSLLPDTDHRIQDPQTTSGPHGPNGSLPRHTQETGSPKLGVVSGPLGPGPTRIA